MQSGGQILRRLSRHSRPGKALLSEPFRIVKRYCISVSGLAEWEVMPIRLSSIRAILPLTGGAILAAETTTQARALAPSIGTERHDWTARLKSMSGAGERFRSRMAFHLFSLERYRSDCGSP